MPPDLTLDVKADLDAGEFYAEESQDPMTRLVQGSLSIEISVLSVSSVVKFLTDERRSSCELECQRELPLRGTPAKSFSNSDATPTARQTGRPANLGKTYP